MEPTQLEDIEFRVRKIEERLEDAEEQMSQMYHEIRRRPRWRRRRRVRYNPIGVQIALGRVVDRLDRIEKFFETLVKVSELMNPAKPKEPPHD